MAIESINPATGELIKKFDELSNDQVRRKIQEAESSFKKWRHISYTERAEPMLRLSDILYKNAEEHAYTITLEMGKPIKEARAEVEKSALVCKYYAENTKRILAKEFIDSDASESYVRFDPLGVILAVMPWNFPYWQVFRFAAPAIMAGNAGLLKHASNVPMCALKIHESFIQAGFPEHLFNTLLVGSSSVPDIIRHPDVKAATLTGSENAGKKVAAVCGSELKKTVMELGGSDPFIVLDDADLDLTIPVAVKSRMINNGQSCIAAKRFIVVESIASEFEDRFVKEMKKLKIGDPFDENTDQGPMAREDLLLELDAQVKSSIASGAKLLMGGRRLNRPGSFYEATLLTDVKKDMPAYHEEIFGPVASIIKVSDTEEALSVANDTVFGLGSSLWTSDIDRAKLLAKQIDAGSVYINGLMKSDPRLPFGGIKISGYGRELSHYGIKEFVNIKTVWIK